MKRILLLGLLLAAALAPPASAGPLARLFRRGHCGQPAPATFAAPACAGCGQAGPQFAPTPAGVPPQPPVVYAGPGTPAVTVAAAQPQAVPAWGGGCPTCPTRR